MASLLYLMGFFEDPPPVGPMPELQREHALHVTIMPAFSLPDRSKDVFVRTVRTVTEWFPPIPCSPTGQAVFGEAQPAPVVLYDPHCGAPASIFNLHCSLGEALKACSGSYLDVYVGDQYAPHSSYADYEFKAITTLSLIEHRAGFGKDMWNIAEFRLTNDSV